MSVGNKTGGRKKGTLNKRTRDLLDILDAKGYCPVADIIEVAAIARKEYDRSAEVFDAILDQKAKDGVRSPTEDTGPRYLAIMQKSAADLLPYLYPKRKSIEFEGEAANSLTALFKQLADAK